MRCVLRDTGKRRILTLKGPPLGEGELHRREEIEADLDADSPGPVKKGRVSRARWPEPIKSMVNEMIGEERLLIADPHRYPSHHMEGRARRSGGRRTGL